MNRKKKLSAILGFLGFFFTLVFFFFSPCEDVENAPHLLPPKKTTLTVHDGTARTWANSFSNYVKQKKKKKKEKKKKKKKKKKEKKF